MNLYKLLVGNLGIASEISALLTLPKIDGFANR